MKRIEKYLKPFALKLLKGFVLEKNIDPSKIDHKAVKNILIVVRHQMGDMLCASPMMRSVRNYYPNAFITLLAKQSTRFEEIFKNNNSPADEIIYYEYGFENFINLIKDLRNKKPDLVIVPSTVVFSGTNHLAAYYSEAKIRTGVKSFDYEINPVSYLLNIKNDFVWGPKKVHQVERNLDVIRQINIQPSETKIRIDIREENAEFAKKFIAEKFGIEKKILICIHPGAGKESNVWSPVKFAELIFSLNNKVNCNILISEGPDDLKYINELQAVLKEKYNYTNAVRHKGILMNNTALISLSDLFITNDTGVMHLGAGLPVPQISLFGETGAFEWAPIGDDKIAIQSGKNSIKEISTDIVFNSAFRLINSIK